MHRVKFYSHDQKTELFESYCKARRNLQKEIGGRIITTKIEECELELGVDFCDTEIKEFCKTINI